MWWCCVQHLAVDNVGVVVVLVEVAQVVVVVQLFIVDLICWYFWATVARILLDLVGGYVLLVVVMILRLKMIFAGRSGGGGAMEDWGCVA